MTKWHEEGRLWEADHGLMDEEQVAQCARADEGDPFKRKILGLNSAKLYGINTAGNLQQRFKSVPADYEKRMSVDLKKTLELPGFQSDNMSRIKEQYAAIGAEPSNTRYGWIHL